jgi:hypothetical protein
MFGKVTVSRQVPRLLPFAVIAALLAMNMLSVSTVSAQETQNITVILTEFQFNPKTITLTVGQPVQLNIQNQVGCGSQPLVGRPAYFQRQVSESGQQFK